MVSSCRLSTHVHASDNGDYSRSSNATENRQGLKRVRINNNALKTKVFDAVLSTTVSCYTEVYHHDRKMFLPCIPSVQPTSRKEIIKANIKGKTDGLSFTETHKGQVALVATSDKNYEIEYGVFNAKKDFANLPKGKTHSFIFAAVVETNVMDKYGNVSLGDMQERTYFSLTQRGKVEIAETKFLTVLKSQGLPSERKALIETLDKIPREKLNISENEMREAILNFQKKHCGTRVIPTHTNEPQEKFTPRKLAPAEDVFLTTCW